MTIHVMPLSNAGQLNAATAVTTPLRDVANYSSVDTASTAQELRLSVLHTRLWITKNILANQNDCLLIRKLFYFICLWIT
jgi:uncharacterized protein (DUF1501 family)